MVAFKDFVGFLLELLDCLVLSCEFYSAPTTLLTLLALMSLSLESGTCMMFCLIFTRPEVDFDWESPWCPDICVVGMMPTADTLLEEEDPPMFPFAMVTLCLDKFRAPF